MAKQVSENSNIVINLNIKTFFILLASLGSIYATGFYFLNDKLSDVNKNIDQLKKEDIELLKLDNSKINGQLKILIDRK